MSESSNDLRTIRFSCACKLTTGSFKLPPRDLPLSLTLCHCWTCRHQSGLLCITNASLPAGTDFDVQGPVKEYKASEDLSRFFCGNCGANVYLEDKDKKKELCSGLIEGGDGGGEGLVRLDHHIFVKDTGDGGVRDWMPEVEAWEGFKDESEKLEPGLKDGSVKKKADGSSEKKAEQENELHAYCRCKGVSFKITRPDASSANLNAPRGDIVSETSPPKTLVDKIARAWWLRDNGTKYLGGTCACVDCRLASGFDIQTWAFVPQANILQPDGQPLDFTAGTMKRYHSSEGVCREFCGRCGATVFFHKDKRPGLVDVSAGLLDAGEGTRAEGWVSWETGRVSYWEEAQNKELIRVLGEGLKRWGEAKGK